MANSEVPFAWRTALFQSVRVAARGLRHNLGYTVTVVVTLAVSIGANTAIISVVDALLLKSLPYDHPERLGAIYSPSDERPNIDGEQWELLRDGVPAVVAAVSSATTSGVNLQAGRRVEYVRAAGVSASYFDVLAIHPFLGRDFSGGEDRPQGPRVAIISYGLWRRIFTFGPGVLGQAVLLRGEPYTIIGVLPQGAITPLFADIYTPLQPSREGQGQGTNFEAIIRLRDGSSWQQANAEINRAWASALRTQLFAKANPKSLLSYYCVSLQKGETDALRPQVLSLMLAAGFILLIACANLAGLALVRMLQRTGEMATRLALGATRWQVLKQYWIENLLLAVAGGTAAVAVGFLGLRGLLLLLPEHFLPVASVPLDAPVLGFTMFLSLLTSVLFGMLPALTVKELSLRSSMMSRTVTSSGNIRLRQGLIAAEVAMTIVLLAAAGLLVRTIVHLQTMAPGFNPSGLISAKASLDDIRYHDPAAFRNLLNKSLTEMRNIPGVQNAAVALALPYERAPVAGVIVSDGAEAGQEITTNEIYASAGYFDTLQIPVLAGRTFTSADNPEAQRVAVVNQAFARRFFHGANPVGRYIDKDTVIVGVVTDTVISSAAGLNADAAPLTKEEIVYLPAAQIVDARFLSLIHSFFQPSWIIRAAGPVEGLAGQMQNVLTGIDPNLPFSGFYSISDLMDSTLAIQRIEVALLSTMASLALMLSAIGIFALISNIVTQRTREMGIRIALGSTVRDAIIFIGRPAVYASALGLVVGLILCAGTLRIMRSVLFGVAPYDVPTIVAVVLTQGVVTLLATTLPALRIARIDPVKTLREE